MHSFKITPCRPDAASLTALLDLCFGPGRLARTAERLREGNSAVTDYDFCAHDAQSQLIGSISFWPLYIGQAPAVLLGPLAVHPEHQGLGLGQQLMQIALQAVEATRFPFVLLVGDLPYYERVGFQVAPRAVRLPGPVDPTRLLVKGDSALCADLTGLVRPAPDLC
jgi:predicted N-acetyltransferase YhbS